MGEEMSQAGEGELSHKQAGLTASTFPEARDLPRASGDFAWMAELQNFMIEAVQIEFARFMKAATEEKKLSEWRWEMREKVNYS